MFTSYFLLAFGFGNLAMLGWLAAAAAPLLIHLWSRHRFREAPWAAMQFLLAAMRKNARRLQLQQWLLLAVRTLIIALVVLAAAEPYGEQLLTGGRGARAHRVLVIDDSFSMAYRREDVSRFAQAKQLAATLVRDSQSADTFTVILMSRPARIVVGREVVDHANVAAQIEALSQPHAAADLAGTLTRVEEALDDAEAQTKPDRYEVYFFTDLQRVTWAADPGSSGQSGHERLHARVAALADSAALAVIDVGEPRAANLAVTNVSLPDALATVGRETTFDVTLYQFGQQPRSNCVVELLVDNVPVGEQTVDVPAGGDAAVRFTYRFQSPGSYTIAVRAAGDDLAIDDARWLVVPVREEVRVLCVAGRDGAARYVADALNPNPAGDSPIRPVVVSEGDLAELELSDFACVFLCNIGQLTSSEAERLVRYAVAGGGVVFFLGDRVIVDSYNALARGEQPLVPAQLSELISQPQFGLDPLEYRHPIVAPFRGRERAGLLTTPVSRYFRLDLSQSKADAEIAVAMPNGDPFIVAARLGRGRTVLVATDGSLTSVDPTTGEPWTHWPTWPSFLPIVRELLAFATQGQQQQWQQLVGSPLVSRGVAAPGVFSDSTPTALRILRPDGRTEPVSVQTSPTGLEWSYSTIDLSGIYSLVGLPQIEAPRFAVNVDTTESDLAKIDPQQLPAQLVVRDNWQRPADSVAGARLSHAAWNQSLLWLAFVLLFVEAFLAWLFGRGVA